MLKSLRFVSCKVWYWRVHRISIHVLKKVTYNPRCIMSSTMDHTAWAPEGHKRRRRGLNCKSFKMLVYWSFYCSKGLNICIYWISYEYFSPQDRIKHSFKVHTHMLCHRKLCRIHCILYSAVCYVRSYACGCWLLIVDNLGMSSCQPLEGGFSTCWRLLTKGDWSKILFEKMDFRPAKILLIKSTIM